MKTITNDLKAHLAQETTTICTLLRVLRLDGLVFGFTDHDSALTYNDLTYQAATGHTPSNIKTNSALNVDNLEITTYVDLSAITELDALAGLWDYAEVEIFQVNYADLSMGVLNLRKGTMGEMKFGRNEVTAELRGMMQPLQQVIGRIYTIACDADLGDSRCGINLASYTVTGTVTAVTSHQSFTDSGRTEAARYFEGGKLTFISGLNNTYSMEVKSFTSGLITLQQSMIHPVGVGDAYRLSAGCVKTVTDCKTKFNNILNHRGFPTVPGIDRYLSGT